MEKNRNIEYGYGYGYVKVKIKDKERNPYTKIGEIHETEEIGVQLGV